MSRLRPASAAVIRILPFIAVSLLCIPGEGNASACWSEPPNLDGMLYTSELISQIGYETGVANDFQVHAGDEVTVARWWGGYIHAGPGTPHVTSFILRFYEDDGSCKPGSLISEYDIASDANETLVYTQADGTQIYRYEANVSLIAVTDDVVWCEVQAGDHPDGMHWGRLSSATIQNCDSMFKSPFFGFLDWTAFNDLGFSYDASQEFECSHRGCVSPPRGMVLWLPFDEAAGPTARNCAGGNDGTYSLPTPTSGEVGNGLEFQGQIQQTGWWVEVPTYPELDFNDGVENSFTIDAWVYWDPPSNPPCGQTIVRKEGSWRLMTATGSDCEICGLHLHNGSGGAWSSGRQIPIQQWVFVAVTVDAAGTVRFYVDGEPFGNVPTGFAFANSADPVRVGGPDCDFDGKIDEVELFDRALSPDEIRAVYNSSSMGKCKHTCSIPDVEPFFSGQNSVTSTVMICNYGTSDRTYSYSFHPISSCQIPGPTGFVAVPPGPIAVQAGTCASIQVTIPRPAGMDAAGKTACYQMDVNEMETGQWFDWLGRLVDRRDISARFHQKQYTGMKSTPGQAGPIHVENTSAASINIDYRIATYRDDTEPDTDAVRLNGMPPGTPVIGSFNLGPGDTTDIDLSYEFVRADPLHFYTMRLEADMDGDGTPDPLASASLLNVIPPTGAGDAGPPQAPQQTPRSLRLESISPVPGAGPIAFRFAVPGRGRLKVGIYDVAGRLVRDLGEQPREAGEIILTWDVRENDDRPAGPGVYFMRGTFEGADGRKSGHLGRLVIVR